MQGIAEIVWQRADDIRLGEKGPRAVEVVGFENHVERLAGLYRQDVVKSLPYDSETDR
jgi:hypothetical protein